ncbi:uncharacterized protein LOC109826575 [Asparagus officinalis]|uniref:uncharacterized protein LOC109826575 n=1 Tax=Asparagus officinalis TaxID=4686 RepID=UPI00098E28FB|nr:uncharacterized protein LOC109826575 [Asparagus officinalis]
MPWFMTVWDSKNYPKHSFILWLAVLNRLQTKDRLLRRGIIQSAQCCLCSSAQESRSHLFFECYFSSGVWNNILDWLQFRWKACNWDIILAWFNNSLRGRGFKQSVKRLALAASIYCIWKERNNRIFNLKSRNVDQVTRDVKEAILMLFSMVHSQRTISSG